ncbi:MAG: tetratricopeptide repeat protein, partial [Chloroflexi bacterium]|nr:tetratricopeptide repeat protein [Chloroflexota bacterium]
VEFRPDLAQLELNLALLYQQGLDLRRSLQALDRCDSLDPSNPYAHYLRGNLLYKLGMLSQAEQELQNAIRLDPQTGIYHFALAQVLLRHQPSPVSRERARTELQTALSLGMANPAEAHYWLGLCYSGQGEWEKARRELEQSVALAPNAWAAYYALREALLHLGRVTEAREAESRFQGLRKAEDTRMKRQFFLQEVQRNPGSVQAHLQLAEYLAASGNAAEARQELETIRKIAGKRPLPPEIARRITNLFAGGQPARSSG